MSLLRAVWAGQHFAWYLGERLWHQLSGGEDFGIPYPPPSQLLTNKEHFWAWRQDNLIPRNGETLRMACPASLWLEYWTHVSVGPTLPQVYRYRNIVGENPMVGRQLGLIAREYPGVDTGSGALASTQYPPLLPQHYSPHSLSLPGYPEPIAFEMPPYALPDYQSAAPEAWYDFAVHEKSCVGGRDLYIAEERRRFQKEQRRAEKGQRRTARRQTFIDDLSAQLGHLMQDFPQPADSSSSSSDHSAAGAHEGEGPSHQYQTQHLGDDE